jgi:DNA segregation ATPase FtsK/SpoIIIE, S-DNA-T family
MSVLVEDVQVDMILGRGARERGAACDKVPPTLPGVGYVQLDGHREPVRVRAAHVTDSDIRQMNQVRLDSLTDPETLYHAGDGLR